MKTFIKVFILKGKMATHLMNKKNKNVEILVQSKMGMQKNTLPHK